ncbi:MAG: hypothetical protein PVF93_08855 [Chromatiaceae bacterium]
MPRLNLPAIRDASQSVQAAYEAINEQLDAELPPLLDEVIDNLIAGYALVDRLIGEGANLMAPGYSRGVLELNNTVLYGPGEARNASHLRDSLAASEHYFYNKTHSGIGDLIEFFAESRFDNEWHEAAAVYVRMMATPQLFIEGNHRTGALLMSYLLVRRGRPPFVLTPENAVSYFRLSADSGQIKRRSVRMLLRRGGLQRRLAALLALGCDDRFLAGGESGERSRAKR